MLQTVLKRLSELKSDQSGQFGVVAAVCLMVIVATCAVGIEVGNIYKSKQHLQDSTDSISLMAARGDFKKQSDIKAAAEAHFSALYPHAAPGEIELTKVKRRGDSVTIEAVDKRKTLLGNILGVQTIEIAASSTSTIERRNIDIALVLDTTGSMRGAKIQSLKVAANGLVDNLAAMQNDNVRMSVVPFAQYVNVGTSNEGKRWMNAPAGWNGCVGSRPGKMNKVAGYKGVPVQGLNKVSCPTALQPMTKRLNNVKSSISRLDARGWTYMPAGLVWGWRTLDAGLPLANNPPKGQVQKILILMTDGENTKSNSGLYHNGRSQSDADLTTKQLCNAVKGSNIRIYSIAYDIKQASTKNLLRNCATSGADYFDASNASELNNAFQAIGQNLENLRISS